jgi:4-hydroxybenzoate polyprenyltransferase
MALPWPHNTPTLPRVGLTDLRADHPTTTARPVPARLVRAREVAASPVTALVVMLLGLVGLFVLPMVGLPFVALVVLPTVIYQLRAEQRHQLRLGRR